MKTVAYKSIILGKDYLNYWMNSLFITYEKTVDEKNI
jgi:hypothetical protein